MGYSASDIIPRFVQYAGKMERGHEPDGKNGHLRQRFPDGSGSSLYYGTKGWNGPVVEIQSYGSHYPLARLVLTPSGKRRLWVLNGDSYGDRGFARTGTHQQMAREAAQASGTPWVILPFSALREAGIDPDTVHVVEQLPERWTQEEHTAATLEDVPSWERRVRFYRDAAGQRITPPRANDGTEARLNLDGSGWHVSRRSELHGHQSFPVPGPEYQVPLAEEYEEITPGADGLYHYWQQRHWLGEAVFRASHQVRNSKTGRMMRYTRYYLSAFDTDEPRPLYFLAELPRGARPQTVAQAREALKPEEVKVAERAGLAVQRQGDVFAIATEWSTRDLPGPSKHGELVLGVNHRATDVRVKDGRTFARGKLRHSPAGRPPEHVTITLGDGKTWYMLVKNTVPMGRTWDGRLESRAWSLGGGVD